MEGNLKVWIGLGGIVLIATVVIGIAIVDHLAKKRRERTKQQIWKTLLRETPDFECESCGNQRPWRHIDTFAEINPFPPPRIRCRQCEDGWLQPIGEGHHSAPERLDHSEQ